MMSFGLGAWEEHMVGNHDQSMSKSDNENTIEMTYTRKMFLRNVVESFYYREAELLDARRFEEWLELFANDATYEVPIRVTNEEGGDSEVSSRGRIFWDTKSSLEVRVQRIRSGFDWAEQPPSRTRHFLTNVRVELLSGDLIEANANLLVACNRGSDPEYVLYSARRKDILSQVGPDDFLIRSRLVIVDQANLSGNSLSVFL